MLRFLARPATLAALLLTFVLWLLNTAQLSAASPVPVNEPAREVPVALNHPDHPPLPQLARDAAKTLQPITPQQTAAARQQLIAAVQQCDAFLRRSGAPVEAGWKRFLRWDELQAQLQRPEGVEPSAVTILDKFAANKNGLEMPQFTRVRDALKNYLAITAVAGDKSWTDDAAGQIELLAKQLEAYVANPTSGDDAIAIGRTLGMLERTGQAPQLIQGVRHQFWRPNFYATASQRFAAIGFEETQHQIQPVRDNILGTSIRGSANTHVRSTLALGDSARSAQFHVLLGGTAYSNSLGYNGPVTLHTTGITSINAYRSMQMDSRGLTAWPSVARCSTGTTIHSISARSNLIEKIAWKKAGKQKSQGEAIASQHAAARVQAQLNDRTNSTIAENNQKYQEKFVKPLTRRGEFPRDLSFSTRPDRFFVRMLQANGSQLAAPAAPPPHAVPHDLEAQVHESAVVNYGEAILGGFTLTDENLVKILRDDLQAEVPEELQITEDKDPWEITFARQTPARANFAAGKVKMAIRASRFKRAAQTINEPLDISANYNIEKTPDGVKLVRQGDVEVTFLNRDRLGAVQIGLKTFIRRKFEAMFKPEFASEGLKMKGRWERAGTLPLRELVSDGAWLTLGWDLKEPAQPLAAQ